jgi:ech hydrogenase subunit D
MEYSQTFEEIQKLELLSRIFNMNKDGYRLVQISVTVALDKFEIYYSLSKDYNMVNLKIMLGKEEEIESISGIYKYSYLYENEMKDLFGVKVININLDFKGNLYKTAIKTPFNTDVNIEKE